MSVISTIAQPLRTLWFAQGQRTQGKLHVRDAIDIKRTMSLVWLCLMPAALFGMFNLGWQAQATLTEGAASPALWQLGVFNQLTGGLTPDTGVIGLFFYGASFFLPIYLTALLVNLAWELVFAKSRGEALHEGFFVTATLFTLVLPATMPLWLVAMGISFGVVVGKEIFGGLGCNFLNPALAGLAFLYFAYPEQTAGVGVWTAVDGHSGATALTALLSDKDAFDNTLWYQVFSDAAWWDAFLGFIPGAIGETSTLAILIGGGILLLTRLASWRIVAGVLLGTVATATLFNAIGSANNPLFQMPWTWHLVTGGFALGMMFMATDPVTASYTDKGKWAYGGLIGAMAVMIRVVNPGQPEGMMLAILFANLWAPLFDYFVAQSNIKRRLKRHAL
ncbi:NADH:ubiquinone reductase (Na(+)-transporting) subunit B [Ferrimonas pelagia]|uniref:Na(+)-translocating NADH-quinone reductase subunit B n=2 Tax=Ferrimonas pelagia TaxID=1177826 RepID=A0ABP9EGK4_9GAMM